MSTSTTYQIRQERVSDIEKAMHERDAGMIRYFAELEAREGNDEYATSLYQMARRWGREDWSYDESINN